MKNSGNNSSWRQRVVPILLENGLLIALLLFACAVYLMKPSMFRWSSLEGMLRQSADIAVVAFPLALLVMAGSVDLSVGSVSAFCAIMTTMAAQSMGFFPGAIVGLMIGALIGSIHGYLVSYLKLHPVVTTLAGLTLWQGLSLILTNAKTVGMGTVPSEILDYGIGLNHVLFLPIHFYILVAVYGICWSLAHAHKFGERALAVGGGEVPAFLAGINVRLTKLLAHTLVGFGAALAGIMMLIRSGAVHGSDGDGLEFRALTIVLLGGISFQGGQGKMRGVVVALFFMSLLRNSLVLLRTPLYYQHMSSGILIILALLMESVIRRNRAGKL
jgi:ribose transport system permease protein